MSRIEDPARTIIRSRYESACIECRAQIHAGNRCAWSPDHGSLCMRCLANGRRPTWDEPKRGRAIVVADRSLPPWAYLKVSPRTPR